MTLLTPIAPSFTGDTIAVESRHREGMFRRFEPLITIAVNNFPTDTEFTRPPRMAVTTFAARFRDSVQSLSRYKWHVYGKLGPNPDGTGTTINLQKLQALETPSRIWQISVDPSGQSIWFRQKVHHGKMPKLSFAVRTESSASPTPLVDMGREEVEALCLLLNNHRLLGPFLLHNRLPEDFVSSLTSKYDIGIVWDDEKQLTVIS